MIITCPSCNADNTQNTSSSLMEMLVLAVFLTLGYFIIKTFFRNEDIRDIMLFFLLPAFLIDYLWWRYFARISLC